MNRRDLEYSTLFTNMMAEGFIAIDDEGIIKIYNDRAKEIFGIKNKAEISHKEGKLEKGDLIIIANNSFSTDDGNMDEESLKLLGLEGSELEEKEGFLLISEYKGKNLLFKKSEGRSELKSAFEWKDTDIGLEIDFNKNYVNISVNDYNFPWNYIYSIGHMVVLDGKTSELKFYQSPGYTARKESINDLLMGRPYIKKGKDADLLQVLDREIFEIHSSESIIKDFYNLAKGGNKEYENKSATINGYPTLCSIKAIEIDGVRKGAALVVEDISEIEEISKERDEILEKLVLTSKEYREKEEFKREFPNFIGEDEKILEVKRMALRGANTKSNILLLGEVGVGKTLLAENIHNSSEYGEDRFIKIKGNRVNQEFLEVLEGRGTLYIEEVSQLDEKAQEALIEFLDSDKDYRLITSTSENLDEMVISKTFDENLYYKINIFPIYIPPLRERQGDIELLIDYLLPKICKKVGLEEKRISLEGMNLIKEYTWPDNIKELINVLERGVNLALGPNILTKHIVLLGDVQRVEEEPKTLKEELELREKVIIQSTLALNNGDKKKTMKDLDISQSTLYEKLKKYDLN